LVRRSLRRALRELGSPRVRAVLLSTLDGYFGACDEQIKVFYATEDVMRGSVRDICRQAEQADLVLAASPALADTVGDIAEHVLLFPVGCDDAAFVDEQPDGGEISPAPDVWLPGPVAGFAGKLSQRLDLRCLDALARRGHSILLVGPGPRRGIGPELQELVQRPNVTWVGPRGPEAMPSYRRLIDVGLVPFAETQASLLSFELNALEHLAAGRPVVSTDVAATRWLRRDASMMSRDSDVAQGIELLTRDDLTLARTPDEFALRAEAALERGSDGEAVARRRSFARRHSWARRCRVLADELGLDAPRAMDVLV
jgi:teichuronic acid biosynthesis glycosyltransferase TuaH